MKIISILRNQQKTLSIAASLLFALAVTPSVALADHADHKGDRHQNRHAANQQQNRHHEKVIIHHYHKHADTGHRYYRAQKHHRQHKHIRRHHKKHYHSKAYPMRSNHQHHSDRVDLQVSMHSGDFAIRIRD